MGLIDLILNLAALLLWLTWRSIGFTRTAPRSGVSLLATLRRADSKPPGSWYYLAALAGLLLLRSLLYWYIGSTVQWIPRLQLAAISLPFRSDYLGRMLLFSVLSFVLVLAIFYSGLLVLEIVNRGLVDKDPIQRMVRQHLGWVALLPRAVQIILPFAIAFVAWCALAPLLTRLGLMPSTDSRSLLIQQAMVLSVAGYLPWLMALAVILLLQFVNSYVYLGNHALWHYVNTTSQTLVQPVAWLPLQFGRLDFRPAIGIAVLVFAGERAVWGLAALYQRLPL